MTGTRPLALGQLSVWHDIRGLPPSRRHEPNNAAVWPLPPGTGTAQVATALRALVARHPSLRTRYDLHDPDAPRQFAPDSVPETGTGPGSESGSGPGFHGDLTVIEVGAVTPEAHAAEAAAEPFDLGREHGWRARLLTDAGTPSHLVFVKHHIVADAWAQELLHQEFRQALVDPAALATPAPGPAELAADQHAPAGLRRQAAALEHWQRVMDRAPSAAIPSAAIPGGGSAGDVTQGTLRSAPARAAAHAVADRARVSVASAVLAAYARSVARLCGTDALLVQLMSANRFTERWKNLVTSMNQWVPALIEKVPDGELDTLARAVHWSGLTAFRHGMHDVTAVAALRAQRPDAPEPACAFNYVAVPDGAPHPGAAPGAPVGDTTPTLTWEEPFTTIGPRCYARALEDPHGLSVRLTAKGLGREQCATLLWDTHDALLAAAERY